MTNSNASTKVVTGKCRLSYEHLFEPDRIDENSEPKYSASIIISKDDTVTLSKIRAAIEAAIVAGIPTKFNGKRPPKLKTPLRDGDEDRPDDPAYANSYFINASSKRRPQVIDTALNPILDTEEVYSGCYCRFSINFYAFSVSGNLGIAAGLGNVQKISDGERLGGATSALDDFADEFDDI